MCYMHAANITALGTYVTIQNNRMYRPTGLIMAFEGPKNQRTDISV